MTTTEEITTLMDVKKASTVMGNNGAQWELTVTWPWTVGQNTDRTWLDKDKYPDELGAGSYRVVASHRSVKNKREGGQHDGSKPWMWNWAVTRFLGTDVDGGQSATHSAPPKTTPKTNGASTPATYQEQQARGYDLGMSFNKAVDIVIAEHSRTIAGEITTQDIRRWRDRLLHEVILVPVAPPHWCYKHEVQMIQSPKTNVWGHVMADRGGGPPIACKEEI